MEITRAIKHEPITLDGLTEAQIVRRTGRVAGSKFAASWTLPVVTAWLRSQIEARGWTCPPGHHERVRAGFDATVGISEGVAVSTITILVSGRYVHAYPDRDEA
jgi:hypothetical protein